MAGLSKQIFKQGTALILAACMLLQLASMFALPASSSDQYNYQFSSILSLLFVDIDLEDARNLSDPNPDDSEPEKESEEETNENKIYEIAELSTERSFNYRYWMFGETDTQISSHWEKIPTPPPELS